MTVAVAAAVVGVAAVVAVAAAAEMVNSQPLVINYIVSIFCCL